MGASCTVVGASPAWLLDIVFSAVPAVAAAAIMWRGASIDASLPHAAPKDGWGQVHRMVWRGAVHGGNGGGKGGHVYRRLLVLHHQAQRSAGARTDVIQWQHSKRLLNLYACRQQVDRGRQGRQQGGEGPVAEHTAGGKAPSQMLFWQLQTAIQK